MARTKDSHSPRATEVAEHYSSGYEAGRLYQRAGNLDRERTHELLMRFLPSPPANILDVGGGPGDHACWLARQGYQVHLMDITPLHVQMAREASLRQPESQLAGTLVGDACSLPWGKETAEAVLLFGPLYHLTDERDRLLALKAAFRVLKPRGLLFAVGISRFVSMFDGLRKEFLKDPRFAEIVTQDLKDGQHRNPTHHPEYFMDTFFHHPDQLRKEVAQAGFQVKDVYGVEGPGWLVRDFEEWWRSVEYQNLLLEIARAVETEASLLGVSAHLIAVAVKG